MAAGLQHFNNRDSSGHPLLNANAGEELMRVQPNVSIALGSTPLQSPGTLYISTKRVIWLSECDREKGYAVDFLSISLHAVSRDPEAYPLPCIYTQIDAEEGEDEESEGSDSESSEDFDLSKVTEMRLVPSDHSQLDELFDIFCQCAELNPEPLEEGEEENTWFYGNEEMADDVLGHEIEWNISEDLANPIGYANGGHDIATSVRELHIDDQRFQDADEVAEYDSPDEHQGSVQ